MKEDKPQTLTPKQEIFINKYLGHFNATRAAIEAGYSEKTAQQMGSENLSKPVIKDIVRGHLNTEYSDERIDKELGRIAFSNIVDMVDSNGELKELGKLTDDQKACISEIKTQSGEGYSSKTIKVHNKLKAIETIVAVRGRVKDDNKNTIPLTPNIQIQQIIVEDGEQARKIEKLVEETTRKLLDKSE